jgi:hypothetical protein
MTFNPDSEDQRIEVKFDLSKPNVKAYFDFPAARGVLLALGFAPEMVQGHEWFVCRAQPHFATVIDLKRALEALRPADFAAEFAAKLDGALRADAQRRVAQPMRHGRSDDAAR